MSVLGGHGRAHGSGEVWGRQGKEAPLPSLVGEEGKERRSLVGVRRRRSFQGS